MHAKGETHIVIITVRAVLVALLVVGHVLAERLLALFADERHLHRFSELVVLRFGVAFGAVEPLFAARSPDRDLRVEDVLASRGVDQNASV